MGSGKSTVGPRVAACLGYRFVDADDEISARAGASIAEIFRTRGEAGFRELEARTLTDLLRLPDCVLATGGGAFAQPDSATALLEAAFTIHLHCDFREIERRVGGLSHRPLVGKGETALAALYAERKDKYALAHATVDATHRSPEEVAGEVLRLLKAPSP